MRKGLDGTKEGLNWLRRDPRDKIPAELTRIIGLDFKCVPLNAFGQNLRGAEEDVVSQTAGLARMIYEVSREENAETKSP